MKSDLVRHGYNKVAEDYSSSRDVFKSNKYLDRLIELLPANATILDIGCGSGVPVDRYLLDRGHGVIGLDISEKQIELAKRNNPQAMYEVRDMQELKPSEYSVDAIVSFYAIFHTPRENHLKLLKTLSFYLKERGLLLITMGASEWEGTEDFHGTT